MLQPSYLLSWVLQQHGASLFQCTTCTLSFIHSKSPTKVCMGSENGLMFYVHQYKRKTKQKQTPPLPSNHLALKQPLPMSSWITADGVERRCTFILQKQPLFHSLKHPPSTQHTDTLLLPPPSQTVTTQWRYGLNAQHLDNAVCSVFIPSLFFPVMHPHTTSLTPNNTQTPPDIFSKATHIHNGTGRTGFQQGVRGRGG